MAVLDDRPDPGKEPAITMEVWKTAVGPVCQPEGHPCLAKLAQGLNRKLVRAQHARVAGSGARPDEKLGKFYGLLERSRPKRFPMHCKLFEADRKDAHGSSHR